MTQLFVLNPWLALCAMIAVVIIACVAIAVITDYLRKTKQAGIDAYLKQDMLNRGMSAEDIKTVLEASGDSDAALALRGNQGVRVGLGKLQVEVGALRKSADAMSESAATHG